MEQFFDIACRAGGPAPNAVVPATVKAPSTTAESLAAGRRRSSGAGQPARHPRSSASSASTRSWPSSAPAPRRRPSSSAGSPRARRLRGGGERCLRARGEGAAALAEAAVAAADEPSSFDYMYPLEAPIAEKIEATARERLRRRRRAPLPATVRSIEHFTAADRRPAYLHGEDGICRLRTTCSPTTAPTIAGDGGDVRACYLAGWLPFPRGHADDAGLLGATAAAFDVDIDADGRHGRPLRMPV